MQLNTRLSGRPPILPSHCGCMKRPRMMASTPSNAKSAGEFFGCYSEVCPDIRSPQSSHRTCQYLQLISPCQSCSVDRYVCGMKIAQCISPKSSMTSSQFTFCSSSHMWLRLTNRFLSSITPSAYLPQPHGKTAIVSGLNYTSRIFALLGEILVRIRVDKRSPPQGQFATARLEEVQSLHNRILAALIHAPELLRLKQTHTHTHLPPEYGGAGFRQATFAEVKDFFDNPNASRANALNPFLVMQANLYVTQVHLTPLLLCWHMLTLDFAATCSICDRTVSRRACYVSSG